MSIPWMPLYIADYLADTAHLSAAEHGAYLLLIMHYFRNGELPKDDKKLQRISRMTAREWEASRETIAAFFDADWKHKRIENEIDKSLRKSHARATSGSRGGHAKSLKNKEAALANATILLQQTGKQNDDFALASSSLSHTEKKEDSSLRSESKKERVTGTRLPESWEPSEDSEFALSKLPPAAAEEIKKFRDYWLAVPGAKGRKLDWQRTWNNWWRNAEHRQTRNVVPLIRHGPARETPRETMERIMKQMENGDDVGLFESSNLPLVSLQR